jgi:hypothetical protein
MSLSVLVIVEIIEITLVCFENVENKFMSFTYFRNYRKIPICFLIVYLSFYAVAAVDQIQAQAQAQNQARAEAQAVRAELEAYVTPQLLDRDIDRMHRSFLCAVLGEDVGHVRSRTTRTWVPKYVN